MSTTVRPLDPKTDRDTLAALYRSFTAKAYQQRVQGIDADRLATFLAEGTCNTTGPHHIRVAEQDNRLVGIAGLQGPHWHTEHTGFPVGKVTQLMTAPDAEEALIPLLDEIETLAWGMRFKHLTARVDASCFRSQEILTRRGWYPVETSVKLVASLSPSPPSPSPAEESGENEFPIRLYQPDDREDVLRIASQSHSENHLFYDPHLPTEAARSIFKTWVEKCLDGLAYQVWIAEYDSRVVGFTTILNPRRINDALGTRIAVLDFIVIDDTVKGQGLGSKFLLAVHREVAREFNQIELRTTATNYPALHLYTKHGYRIVSSDQVFGKWYSRSERTCSMPNSSISSISPSPGCAER